MKPNLFELYYDFIIKIDISLYDNTLLIDHLNEN
jgi:hypothetical protein